MRKKVLYLQGGSTHYFVKILNKLNFHFDINVIVPQDSAHILGTGVKSVDEGFNYNVIKLKENISWYKKPYFENLKREIIKIKPEVIIIGWPYYFQLVFNPLLLIYIKTKKIKLIVREIPFKIPLYNENIEQFRVKAVESTIGEAVYNNKLVFYFQKIIFKILYKYIFDSAQTYTDEGYEVLSSYGMSKERIKVTYNSSDTETMLKTIEENNLIYTPKIKNRIIHVGRLAYWKRVDLLIDSINILKEEIQDISLSIVGNGDQMEILKEKVNALNLNDRIFFEGAIYEEKKLCELFQQSDLYVLAGMGGLSINEAMCNSLPIVCSICDGTEKHLVIEGHNGYFFKADDLASLSDKIKLILMNDDLKLKMGQNSLEIIKNNINIHSVVEKIKDSIEFTLNIN